MFCFKNNQSKLVKNQPKLSDKVFMGKSFTICHVSKRSVKLEFESHQFWEIGGGGVGG